MSTIINGTSSAITFPDTTVQNTAFTTGAVTQSTIANGVAGTGPAFSASRTTSTQAISSGVETKIQFQTETFDTASCYDNATNYRFTPTVAGYYQINGSVNMDGSALQLVAIRMFKNGTFYKAGNGLYDTSGVGEGGVSNVSDVVYLNGTTDYVEMYAIFLGSSATIGYADKSTFFSGALVRAA